MASDDRIPRRMATLRACRTAKGCLDPINRSFRTNIKLETGLGEVLLDKMGFRNLGSDKRVGAISYHLDGKCGNKDLEKPLSFIGTESGDEILCLCVRDLEATNDGDENDEGSSFMQTSFRRCPYAIDAVKPDGNDTDVALIEGEVGRWKDKNELLGEIRKQMGLELSRKIRIWCHLDDEPCRERRKLAKILDPADHPHTYPGDLYVHITMRDHPTSEPEDDRGILLESDIMVQLKVYQGVWDAKQENWRPRSIHQPKWFKSKGFLVAPDSKIEDLPIAFGDKLKEAIDADEQKQERLALGMLQYTYTSMIAFPKSRGMFVSLDDDKFRVATLSDLFDDPTASGNILEATVIVEAKELTAEEKLKQPELVRRTETPPRFEFFRLGNVLNSTKDRSTSRLPNTFANNIHSDWALLAWRYPGSNEPLKLFKTPAFVWKDEFCIGDCYSDTHYPVDRFSKNHDYFDPYTQLESFKHLSNRIEKYSGDPKAKVVGEGVPFLPPFCFNKLDATNAKRWGLYPDKLPNKKLQIAVRCVNHLSINNGTDVNFPHALILKPDRNDISANGIRDLIIAELKAFAQKSQSKGKETDGDVEHIAANQLFESKDLRDFWAIELWIRPQMKDMAATPEQVAIYYYAAIEDAVGPGLQVFVHQDAEKDEEWRLYMEAHIVPKEGIYMVTGTICDPDIFPE